MSDNQGIPLSLAKDTHLKPWAAMALELLKATLEPPRHEINELDWKTELSPDKGRLTEHLSAFANYAGGGHLVFGLGNDGNPLGIDEASLERIVNQLANLGRDAVEPPLSIDHGCIDYGNTRLLVVRVRESPVKPVHVRGKSIEHAFIRSGGTSRRASRQEVGAMMLQSRIPRWEESNASVLLTDSELLEALEPETILRMLSRPSPKTGEEMLMWMAGEKFITREPSGGGYVTNLGAIAAARKIADYPDISRKAVRVIVYDGLNKTQTKSETVGSSGYAIRFERILKFVVDHLPHSEVIEQALRQKRAMYPVVALRELIANALIHQDFCLSGSSPMIEIFDDRVEISNPGGLLPSKRLDRLIGTQPESRNEQLAGSFRRYQICEEQGSGLLRAGLEVELYGLPPMEFSASSSHFKAILHAPRTFAQMSGPERIEACYQHAVLRHLSSDFLSNKSLRERLKMPDGKVKMVSELINEAVEKGRIKAADPANKSTRYAKYVPYWA